VAVVVVVQVVEPAAAVEGVAAALKAIRAVWVALDRLQLDLGMGEFFWTPRITSVRWNFRSG